MAKNWSRVAGFVVLSSCVNCGPRTEVIEDPGTPLVYGVEMTGPSTVNFAWVFGNAEIAYVSTASAYKARELRAVRMSDRTSRTLDTANPYFLAGLARSRDGRAMYFISEAWSGGVVNYRLHEAITDQEAPVGNVSQMTPAVSPDSRQVLYWTSGARLLETTSGTSSALTCSAGPVPPIFSSSGDQLLCGGEHPTLVTLATDATQTLPDTYFYVWRAVHWGSTGLQAVALVPEMQSGVVYLVDVVSGEARALYETDRESLLNLAHAAISEDGGRVAFWVTQCLKAKSIFSCEPGKEEARLKVVEVSSGSAKTVASSAGYPGPIAFSDDGTQLAYVFGATLYVRAVP